MLREAVEKVTAQMVAAGLYKPVDMTGIRKQDIQVPTRDGSSIRAILYRPESEEPGPLLVYFHGGGWIFGPPDDWNAKMVVLVKELGFVALSVDYRLAPEHVFPTAAHDAWDALK